jgi:ribose 5-phosphate isomerase A
MATPSVTSAPDALKRQSADAALARVESGMVVGLGSGSTAALFIEALGRLVRSEVLEGIRGIPTSEASRRLAEQAGIALVSFAEAERCDLTVDGADEIDARLNLIKGLGGALLREKIVAQNSARVLIIADAGKLVDRLGTRTPLPVEVVPFGAERQPDFFRRLGGEPRQRMAADGKPYLTDGGNFIFDVQFGPIDDPAELEIRLLRRAGVVQTGLFLGIAHEAIVADAEGVRVLSGR